MYPWDPLDIEGSETTEILAAAKKREIRNILKSYVGFFDPFGELVQNALDAVDLRESQLTEAGYKKKLRIEIDLKENTLTVADNGIGFDEAQFRTFLSPSISFKSAKNLRGNKGVGATYLAYGFNDLCIVTRTPQFSASVEIRDGREWVDDDAGVKTRPIVKETAEQPHFINDIDRGTVFRLRFVGNVRPRNLSWIGAATAEQWKVLLLVKTPLGQIINVATPPTIAFDLSVIDEKGNKTQIYDQLCRYIYPNTVIKACARIRDILAEQSKLIQSGKDASKLPAKYKKLNAVYDEWDSTSLSQLPFKDEDKQLIATHGIWAYGFFCYSATNVFDRYSDDTAKLRKGLRIIRGGLQLATNSMPQGELITIPLTSNIGYQNQAHIVVHLTNADPDLGRKGFQPELQRLSERIAVLLVTRLKRWRSQLLTDHGPGATHQEDLALDEWINAQKDYEKTHPIHLSNKNFFVPINEISITAEPNSEQDVIALFNQLVAGGVIRGIRLMASSSHKQYDGLFRFVRTEPLMHHVFDAADNPLGVDGQTVTAAFTSKPYVLEFKFSFDQLITDFENEEKTPSSINLAIVWHLGDRYAERYQVVSLLLPDNLHLRQFHGVTHELHDDHTGEKRMDVIVLSDLLAYLNDSGGEIARQEKLYSNSDLDPDSETGDTS